MSVSVYNPKWAVFQDGLIREKDIMESKPTYDELQKRVLELKIEAANCRFAEESLQKSNEIVNSILSACPKLNALREMSRKLMHITRYETRDYVKGEKIIDLDKSSGTMNPYPVGSASES